jgi:hypothetical protein
MAHWSWIPSGRRSTSSTFFTSSKRQQLTEIIGAWIDGCVDAGFQAVEIDNLDTFTRFPGLLDEDDAVRFAQLLSARAHSAGAAIGQKNTVELVDRRAETGFDFAVVEQCNEFIRRFC